MKNSFFRLGFVFLAFVIEGTVRFLPLTSVRVDFIWLVALYVGFFVPVFPGAIFIFLLGLAQESLGMPFHGPLLLSYLILYFFLRMSHRTLSLEGGVAQVVWVILLTGMQNVLMQGFLLWGGYPPVFDTWRLLPSAALHGFVSLPLFPFLKNPGRWTARFSGKGKHRKVSLQCL